MAVLREEGAARRGVPAGPDAGGRGGLPVCSTAGGEAAGGHADHAAHAVVLTAADDVVLTEADVVWGQCGQAPPAQEAAGRI